MSASLESAVEIYLCGENKKLVLMREGRAGHHLPCHTVGSSLQSHQSSSNKIDSDSPPM